MDKFLRLMKNEIIGWKKWETTWLISATLFITILSLYTNNNTISIIAAVTGVISVICSGKGKLSGFLFGIINAILYSIIAYHTKYYGEMTLNLMYYIPMQIYGFYIWSKHINPKTQEIYKRKMSYKERISLIIILIIATIICGFILNYVNDNAPFIDSLSTILAIITMYIAINRYLEQWILWIISNSVKLLLWMITLFNGNSNIAIMLMSSIYLTNSFIMYYKWKKEIDNN